jgi:type I restriction enzyme R subunit
MIVAAGLDQAFWSRALQPPGEERLRGLLEKLLGRFSVTVPLTSAHIDAYNMGTLDVEAFFEALKKLVSDMDEEERRAAREGLTEDELAIFDLLTKPEPKLTKAQEVEVKKVARELLVKLQEQLKVQQWQLRPQPRAAVKSTIRFALNELPEEPYPEPIWDGKVDAVWQFVFNRYHADIAPGAAH